MTETDREVILAVTTAATLFMATLTVVVGMDRRVSETTIIILATITALILIMGHRMAE